MSFVTLVMREGRMTWMEAGAWEKESVSPGSSSIVESSATWSGFDSERNESGWGDRNIEERTGDVGEHHACKFSNCLLTLPRIRTMLSRVSLIFGHAIIRSAPFLIRYYEFLNTVFFHSIISSRKLCH